LNTALLHTLCYSFLIGLLVATLDHKPSTSPEVDKAKDEVILQLSEDYVKAVKERPYVDLWARDKANAVLKPLPPLGGAKV